MHTIECLVSTAQRVFSLIHVSHIVKMQPPSFLASRFFSCLHAFMRLSTLTTDSHGTVKSTILCCKWPKKICVTGQNGTSSAAASRPYTTLARRTSLMAQFQRVKAQFPDHLLLFQVGDFYELYGEDASEYVFSPSPSLPSPSPPSLPSPPSPLSCKVKQPLPFPSLSFFPSFTQGEASSSLPFPLPLPLFHTR